MTPNDNEAIIIFDINNVNNIITARYTHGGGDIMEAETRFTARIPEEDYAKLRVVAAMRGESINLTLCDAITAYLLQWEETHGKIPVIRK